MNTSKLSYSRTIEVGPEYAELLNHLVDRYIIPVIDRKIAQGAISGKTPEQELAATLSFGTSGRTEIPAQRTPINLAQGGLNTKELEDLRKILNFGKGPDKPITTEEEE